MAAGDTIAGSIRVMKETAIGHTFLVAGKFVAAQCDHLTDLENGIFINPRKGESLPLGMMPRLAPKAIFEAGEKMLLQHLSASLEELATVTLSEIQVDIIIEDLNTGDFVSSTLVVGDTTLSGDVTTSKTGWVSFFSYTIPDRYRIYLAGSFNATVLEKA